MRLADPIIASFLTVIGMSALATVAVETRDFHARRADSPDAVLYERMREGDDLSFRTLMERHRRMAEVICRNIVGDPDEARDVVQDVFFSLWRRGGWVCGSVKFSTWLHRVVINRAIDHRRRRRDPPTPDGELAAAIESSAERSGGAEEGLVRAEVAEGLRSAIARLPAAQRQALSLHYFEDADVAEITARMATTENAVRSLLKRGKMTLRDELRNQKKIWSHDPDRMARPS